MSIEYAVIAALIAAAVVGGATLVGQASSGNYDTVADAMS